MIRIGVIGQSGEVSLEMQALAESVGKEIASRGALLISGGTSGVMEAASRGAKLAGGLVVGILPGDTADTGNEYIDIPITTGLGFDYRSLIIIHSSDAVIMVGGENGTLGELSAAYLNRKPIAVIEGSGGWAARIKTICYEGTYLDTRKSVKLNFAQTAKEALDILLARLENTCKPANTDPQG